MTRSNGTGLRVAIVGGGITGLSAAWYLQKAAREHNLPLKYTLLEQSERWGGKIKTEYEDGFGDSPFVIEGGPDSFITQKPWASQLSRELGLAASFLPTNDDRRKTFVLNKAKPAPLPDGVLLIVPTKIMPFLLSPLLSLPGKLRMGLDLIIPAKRDGEDETLADFITRRLGAEALDKIAEPLMSGIYNADADKQSILATFPRFRTLEEKYGSLTRGMLASRNARQKSSGTAPPRQPTSMFVSFKEGMETLVDELVRQLDGDMRLRIGVRRLQPYAGGYRLDLTDETTLEADLVILAVPAYVAGKLVSEIAPQAATGLQAIRYVSTGTISLAYRAADIAHPLDGFGLVIPRSENRPINAVTWTSTKFDNRAPEGYVLLRVFFGGSRNPQMMDKGDEELIGIVRQELDTLLGIDADPLFERIYRWFDANPQYDVGHLDRVAEIEAALPPEVFVTGSPYRGIGIPDCVHQAQLTVEQIVNQLRISRVERQAQRQAQNT